LGCFWVFFLVGGLLELPMFLRFLSRLASTALLALGFLVWWASPAASSVRRASWGSAWPLWAVLARRSSPDEVGLLPWFLLAVPVW